MQNLTILHTASTCHNSAQEYRILSEIKAMLDRDHKIGLFTPFQTPLYENAIKMGIDVFTGDIHKNNYRRMKTAYDWLKRYRVDIVNCHDTRDHWLFSISRLRLRKQCQLLRTLHGPAPLSRAPYNYLLYRYGTSQIIATNEQMHQSLINRNRLPEGKICTIPNGIDLNIYERGNQLRARNAVNMPVNVSLIGVTVGSDQEIDYETLLDSITQLPEEFFLVIIGDSLTLPQIKEHTQSLGLDHRVHFAGQTENILPWLQALDLYILPATLETPLPMTLLQSMACEVPVISTPADSISDVIEDGETGILFPPHDSQALTLAIETLFRNSKLYRNLASRGYQVAQERFGITAMVDTTEALYEKLLA